jgi:cytochrome P450
MPHAAPAIGPPSNGRLPPGPGGRQLVDALVALRSRPLEYLLDLSLRYGPVACLAFPFERVVLLSGPDAIQYVLHQNHANYVKETGRWRAFREILGNGLLTSDGDLWRRQRQRVQPAFHAERLAQFERAAHAQVSETLGRWRELAAAGKPVVLYPEMLRLSLVTIVKAMFGRDVRDVAGAAVRAFMDAHVYINPMSLPNLLGLPPLVKRFVAPGFRRFERAFGVLDAIVNRLISERLAGPGDHLDLLSLMMAGRDEDVGEAMTPTQLRDEVMTMFMAGHETVSIALTWSLYLLSKYPAARRDLEAEIRTVLNGRMPGLQDLPDLKLTRMVIDESMRLFPPAWGFDRRARAEDHILGYRIPARSTVAMSAYVVHRHPAYWENPEGFDPLRFANRDAAGRPDYTYFPFGGGPRRCVGFRFALAVMQIFLAAIVQQFALDLVPGPPIAPRPVLNLPPNRPFLMTLRPQPAAPGQPQPVA